MERKENFQEHQIPGKPGTIHKKSSPKSRSHYLKACLQHILILIWYVQHVISNQWKCSLTAGNLSNHSWQSGRQGPWDLGWHSWGHYCTQSNTTHTHTHTNTNRHTKCLVVDNSHPVIFNCVPLMLDQRHLTHSSVGLGPPGVPLPPKKDCQRVTSALQNKHRNQLV